MVNGINYSRCWVRDGVADGARTHDNRNHNRTKRVKQRNQQHTKAIKSISWLFPLVASPPLLLPVSVPRVCHGTVGLKVTTASNPIWSGLQRRATARFLLGDEVSWGWGSFNASNTFHFVSSQRPALPTKTGTQLTTKSSRRFQCGEAVTFAEFPQLASY